MKVKAFELRNKTSKELLNEVNDFKGELQSLRVSKATGAAAAKLAKIRVIRKNIARVLTVYNQKVKKEARQSYAGKKYIAQDLRAKKTRAIRRSLTSVQKKIVSSREAKRSANFPKRRFAVSA